MAVIVHAGRDNYANVPHRYRTVSTVSGPDAATLATGDAGARYACGVVELRPLFVPTGYWMAAADGGGGDAGARFACGVVASLGGIPLNRAIVAISATPRGRGYLLVASDGGVFSFGDAPFQGSLGGLCECLHFEGADLSQSGQGYSLFTPDGSGFHFGDASFFGPHDQPRLNAPVIDGAIKR